MFQKMTANLKKRRFSMVEIVLALIVAIVGVIGLIGLFPLGLDSNRKSAGDSYASDSTEQFLHFMASAVKVDDNMLNAYPEHKDDSVDTMTCTWSDTLTDPADQSDPLMYNDQVRILFPLNTGDTAATVFDPSMHNTGVFKLQQLTGGNIDFECIMYIWQTEGSIILHVEACYPPSLPPEKRDCVTNELTIGSPKVMQMAQLSNTCAIEEGAGDYVVSIDSVVDGSGCSVTCPGESGSGSGSGSSSSSSSSTAICCRTVTITASPIRTGANYPNVPSMITFAFDDASAVDSASALSGSGSWSSNTWSVANSMFAAVNSTVTYTFEVDSTVIPNLTISIPNITDGLEGGTVNFTSADFEDVYEQCGNTTDDCCDMGSGSGS